jgi:protein-L-isoaspartate(D-aspartate) O-methyltransferase
MSQTERLLKDRLHPRLNMINGQLRPNGVCEEKLIHAFESVPMEAFVPPAIQPLVYSDGDLPLNKVPDNKRWLLSPLTLGKLLQLANIEPTDRVLIIGCGTGYSIAVVAQIAAHVIGIECDENLAYSARIYAAEQEIFNIQVVTGSLNVGYPKEAPYDVILIEGAVESIPMVLMQQLSASNGRLVTILKGKTATEQEEFGRGVLLTRVDDRVTQVEKFDANCAYLPDFELPPTFTI